MLKKEKLLPRNENLSSANWKQLLEKASEKINYINNINNDLYRQV